MCYGIILNNGQRCQHEKLSGVDAGECGKRRGVACPEILEDEENEEDE